MNLSRRDFGRLSGLGLLAAPASGWLQVLAAHAADQPGSKHKACILLYMDGGASHLDTFDPKPGNGEFKSIKTAVTGVQISEHLPLVAAQMKEIALIRGMSTAEGAHARAKYAMHTGYRQGAGGLIQPSMGAKVSAVLGGVGTEIPNFVSIGGNSFGSSFLGPAHAPLIITRPDKGVDDLRPAGSLAELDLKASLLDQMESRFLDRKQASAVEAHQATYQAAQRLMHSAKSAAFDIRNEPESSRSAFGDDAFSQGCLLARRLVEVGVRFVEVRLDGWDTHKDNFTRVKNLSQKLDLGMGSLIADLKKRGMLQDTVVAWMGDFGRTPKLNNGGRGHYPRAWSTLLAGGGLKTGQVIGKTDKDGGEVVDDKVSISHYLATICKAMGIDPNHEFRTNTGRPIRIVDKPGEPIAKLV